ncbi:MAG: response regulator [bacterium]|nr:response regulator [bacterium]
MKIQAKQPDSKSWQIKPWVYIAFLCVNVLIFACIGAVYIASTRDYSKKLFDENVSSVDSLNKASANAAYTYINSMGIKLDDMVSYIENNHLSYSETMKYLEDANTDPDRQFQLVLCGTYGKTGELSFGDYSGISFRRIQDGNGSYSTIKKEIVYGSGYYDIFRSFTDVQDDNFEGICSTPEFTDPDTKLKCFAVYRHVTLQMVSGEEQLYTLLLATNSETALDSYNMQNEYEGQSAVLINENGDYIIKNSDYRNVNFYDYIVNYNDLTFDRKKEMQEQILTAAEEGISTTNLFYKNHKGDDCIYAVTIMENHWYSVTCVPIASFNHEDESVNYSLFIMVLFSVLFFVDAIAVFFLSRFMSYNIKIANQAQEEADKANQAKSRFLSTMTHELRTPLNAVIGLTSLAGDSIEEPPVLKDYLGKIDISSKLLLQIISDILDISAIESNKIKLNDSEFDMTKLIASLSTIYYDQCVAKGIEFSVVLKDIHSEILIGDFIRINQILLNYLSNAVKFTPSGGKITLRAEQVEKADNTATIKFSVSDTGCGISEDMKPRLFNPFERAGGDEARKYSGTGLGLSITKSLVELMNGQVGVESKAGEGACFWAVIPFATATEKLCRSYTQIENLKILVTVSNWEEREYISKILSNFGVDYRLKESANEALDVLREEKEQEKFFDLCLLDWKMSDLTAIDAVTQIRREFDDKKLRIVVMAYDLAEARKLCIGAGADFVFGKPVFQSALYNFLEEVVSNRVRTVPDMKQSYDFSGKRVLLVEDNRMNKEVAKKMLEKVGLDVEIAENGQIASELFKASKQGHFDLILMDIQMPVMNGYDATRTIRQCTHKQAKSIPIVAMTADAFTEDVEKAHAAGMNEHLAKPIVREVLYATLKKYLN